MVCLNASKEHCMKRSKSELLAMRGVTMQTKDFWSSRSIGQRLVQALALHLLDSFGVVAHENIRLQSLIRFFQCSVGGVAFAIGTRK
jgi:hypothetical protein